MTEGTNDIHIKRSFHRLRVPHLYLQFRWGINCVAYSFQRMDHIIYFLVSIQTIRIDIYLWSGSFTIFERFFKV